ncbi:MAG: SDR family oxidoreductase [Pseudomonadota bacterium]
METTLITGANRGIGLGLAERFIAAGHKVLATCRHPAEAGALQTLAQQGTLEVHALDVTDESGVRELQQRLDGVCLDVLINNAGVLGDHRKQSLDNMDYEQWRMLFEVNTIAPFRLIGALKGNLAMSANPRVITVSAGMASFSRTDPGLHAYRSSKAALNKLMQVLSIELAADGIAVCSVHPGWVQTDMSGGTGDLSVAECAAGIYKLTSELENEHSGRFWTWAGDELSW